MISTFKLIGLNGGRKKAYATVRCGREDWFHADFDPQKIPEDRQVALFKYAKETDEFWKLGVTVDVQFTHYTRETPINPIIVAINIPKH